MKKRKPARPAKAGAVALPARLTIAQSVDLHAALIKALAGGERLWLDGSQVEEIDTAILQLLASACTEASQRGIACKWQGTSSALREAATLIGVSELLRFDQAA